MPDLVARSGVPIIFCPERNISGIMVTSWKSTNQWPLTSYCTGSPTLFGMKVQLKTYFHRFPIEYFTCMLHRTKSSCQELTSGTYLTITLLKEAK